MSMSTSRRFLNLIVHDRTHGAQSLRCLDLTRHSLFNTDIAPPPNVKNQPLPPPPTPPPAAAAAAAVETSKIKKISLPRLSITMRSSSLHCFPAADRRVFCFDQEGRGLLLEADTNRMVMLPQLHKPKMEPVSLYIPCADDQADDLDGGGGGDRGTLFVTDRVAVPEAEAGSQFEALVYRNFHTLLPNKSWDCDRFPPPPPYIHGAAAAAAAAGQTCRRRLEITSYAVVNGGSQVCVSVDGAGTYCLDTASYAWSEVGKWTLPFRGRVQYEPELKLWFGFSAEDGHLAAADLSAMDSLESQPQLLDSWKELDVPKRWQQVQDPQLVSLGSGRFCVARFLARTGTANRGLVDESSHRNVTVLTGVEVVDIANGFNNGRVNLGMVKHKSRCHKSRCGEDTVTAVL